MPPTFDGNTYDEELDGSRLGAQMQAVRGIMKDGTWRTPEEIAALMPQNSTVASITARLRDLRKPKFGSHEVQRRRRGDGRTGSHEYRLVLARKDDDKSDVVDHN